MKTFFVCSLVLVAAAAVSAQRSPTWEQLIAQHENERSALYNRQESEQKLLIEIQKRSLETQSSESLKSDLAHKHIEERDKLSHRHAAERTEMAKLHHAERQNFGKPTERQDEDRPAAVGGQPAGDVEIAGDDAEEALFFEDCDAVRHN